MQLRTKERLKRIESMLEEGLERIRKEKEIKRVINRFKYFKQAIVQVFFELLLLIFEF